MRGLRDTGLVIVGLALMVGLFVGFVWLLRAGVDVGIWAMPWLQLTNEIALAICVLVLLPLAAFGKTRPFAALGFQIASYSFGISLWFLGLLVTYAFWGMFGVLFGLMILGIGVVPVGAVAALLHSEWSPLGQIALGFTLTYGSRLLCVYLLHKSGPSIRRAPSTAAI